MNNVEATNRTQAGDPREAPVSKIADELQRLLVDVFVLYVKTKNYHWHLSRRNFREHHAILDEQGEQVFDIIYEISEHAQKVGGTTARPIGGIAGHKRLEDNGAEGVPSRDMLAELRTDNQQLTRFLRRIHEMCARHNVEATASAIESWIAQAERRAWFLSSICEGSSCISHT